MAKKKICEQGAGENVGLQNTDFHIEKYQVALSALSPAAIARLLDKCKVAESLIKNIRAQAKEMIKNNPESVPGWGLSKPSTVRSIEEPFSVFKALRDAAIITPEQFLTDCISVGVGDLEKAISKHNKMKAAEAKDTVNSICGPFIKLKPKEPSLEKL